MDFPTKPKPVSDVTTNQGHIESLSQPMTLIVKSDKDA